MFRSKLLDVSGRSVLSIIFRGKKTRSKGTFTGKMLTTAEAVRYPGGIKYYPRPGEIEPEVVPAKLLRVERIRTLIGVPWFLKKIFYELGIGEKKKDIKENFVTVVKNIPEVNVVLWKIKHLVLITPITFPYGEPTMDGVRHTQLLDSGVCIVKKEIAPAKESRETRELFTADRKRMNADYVEMDCRKKWLNPFGGGY